MNTKLAISLFAIFALTLPAVGQNTKKSSANHPKIGTEAVADNGAMRIKLIDKRQRYDSNETATLEQALNSPKSINVSPDGKKFYVNSLEGCATVAYDAATNRPLTVINHSFTDADAHLWAPKSGLFSFNHEYKKPNTFMGKPVEGAFSHGGCYFWVPYYRRSFDLNAQDPSALAVIDTRTDKIVRLMETGILPKMIVASPDGNTMAVIHWGDNTVGLIDISGDKPEDWHYRDCVVVGYRFKPNYSMTESVNRDVGSGYCLRGAAFTPDSKRLLVGAMGGGGGIAVIDNENPKYLGMVYGMMPNMRHMCIQDGKLYLTINKNGYVQCTDLNEFLSHVDGTKKEYRHDNWTNAKVGAGARSMVISPDGKYIYVACHGVSKVCVVDAKDMKKICEIDADSFPVGIDLSHDGRTLYVTSQALSNVAKSGNALDIYSIHYHYRY